MAERSVWIGTSWKMNKTLPEALSFAERLNADLKPHPAIQPFVIPPFTAVREIKAALADTGVKVGAQTMHWADAGAWTGEISPAMLVDCGLDLVELGHSERRTHFGETDETVGRKVAAAIAHGLAPLVCVGETMDEREAGRADAVLCEQVRGALAHLDSKAVNSPILFAYEPVWAIGEGGVPASPDYAEERHAKIATQTRELLPDGAPVLYGGSVNPGNCEDLIRRETIDGLFIGRSAWQAEGYLGILSQCAAALDATA
ncbi:triose-phosphate isomerase [Pararhizobium mangrovi]|uniref:Triosephosphate isomerase n=1 Tax=Pararhizobium mangrovi TaxID=2590452 RepID=A0A506TVR6_9HYPH|nr:triose-phosphate isomerase [Pararhizobium mangrovi]TPW26172.1 triose-phosphate isomerase [Pararhizobium mangrovi]